MKQKLFIGFRILLTTFCLTLSCHLLWVSLPRDVEPQLDPEYAVLAASDEVVTQKYPIGACDTLWFCYADYGVESKRTLFTGGVPHIQIINDGGNYVELTTNRSIHNTVSMEVRDSVLAVAFHRELYNQVHEDDTEYDYDLGLYVDCSVFDIVIHSAIHNFRTNTQTVLDFQVGEAQKVILDFSFEGTQANIHDIHAEELTLWCSGDSDVSLSGTVTGEASFSIWHNTKVNATQLKVGQQFTDISSRIFGWSSIKFSNGTLSNPLSLGTVVSAVMVAAPCFWLNRVIRLIRKLTEGKKD